MKKKKLFIRTSQRELTDIYVTMKLKVRHYNIGPFSKIL